MTLISLTPCIEEYQYLIWLIDVYIKIPISHNIKKNYMFDVVYVKSNSITCSFSSLKVAATL